MFTCYDTLLGNLTMLHLFSFACVLQWWINSRIYLILQSFSGEIIQIPCFGKICGKLALFRKYLAIYHIFSIRVSQNRVLNSTRVQWTRVPSNMVLNIIEIKYFFIVLELIKVEYFFLFFSTFCLVQRLHLVLTFSRTSLLAPWPNDLSFYFFIFSFFSSFHTHDIKSQKMQLTCLDFALATSLNASAPFFSSFSPQRVQHT